LWAYCKINDDDDDDDDIGKVCYNLLKLITQGGFTSVGRA